MSGSNGARRAVAGSLTSRSSNGVGAQVDSGENLNADCRLQSQAQFEKAKASSN